MKKFRKTFFYKKNKKMGKNDFNGETMILLLLRKNN